MRRQLVSVFPLAADSVGGDTPPDDAQPLKSGQATTQMAINCWALKDRIKTVSPGKFDLSMASCGMTIASKGLMDWWTESRQWSNEALCGGARGL